MKAKFHATCPGFDASLSSAQLGGVGEQAGKKNKVRIQALHSNPYFAIFFPKTLQAWGDLCGPHAKPCHTRVLRNSSCTQVWVCRERVLPPLAAQNAA